MFDDFDLTGFWAASEYSAKASVDKPVTPEMVAFIRGLEGDEAFDLG